MVVDISHKIWKDQIKIVHSTLKDLNVEKPILYVFNKIDKIEDLEKLKPELEEYQPYVLSHTLSKEGVKGLLESLKNYKY